MYLKYSQGVPEDLIHEVIDFLRFKEQEVMVAPYEADAQLAALWHDRRVDYVVSEDSDLLAFNVPKLIQGLKTDGRCRVLDLTKRGLRDVRLAQVMSLGELNSLRGPTALLRDERLRLSGKRQGCRSHQAA